MDYWFSLCITFCIISSVSTDVILSPSANAYLPVCLGGSASVMCSTTEGPLLWISGSRNRLFNSEQPPEMLGNLTLSVQSAVVTGNTISVTSTATINDFQASLNNSLVECRETTTSISKQATFVTAGPPPAPTVTSITLTQSSTSSSSLLISWSMSDCAVQYVVTIINSSDDSVYPNITTSDTNTTVTLPTGVEFCVTVLGVDSINRTGPASELKSYTFVTSSSTYSTGTTSSETTPSPTGLVNQSSAGPIVAGVLVSVIVLGLLAAVAVVIVVIYRKGLCRMLNHRDSIELNHKFQCVCQVYCQEVSWNSWKVIIAFVSSEDHLEAVKHYFVNCDEYGSPIDCLLESYHAIDTIEMKIPSEIKGWVVENGELESLVDYKVTTAAVEQYTGEGEPPYCEMTFRAADPDNSSPPDLNVDVQIERARIPNVIQLKKKAVKCVCQVFHRKEGINCWRVVFAFFPKIYFQEAKNYYLEATETQQKFEMYDSQVDCDMKSSDIKVKFLKQTDGWIVEGLHTQVCKADVEEYTGECEPPPAIVAIIIAESDRITPPDLTVEATINGLRNSVTIELKEEAQNVIECVCQVFYHKLGFPNHWRATFSFFPKVHEKRVNEFYQDANNCSPFDVKFGGGVIKVSTDGTVIPAGWEVIINQQYQQVTTAAVELYTGEGKPPYCEMTLRATDNAESHSIKQLVTLIGIREQPRNTFYVERVLEKSDGTPLCDFAKNFDNLNNPIVCQVFYHKLEGINHWKATLAFFTKNKTDRVKQFYQDANLGPTFEDVQFTLIIGKLTINPSIKEVSSGWNVPRKVLQKIIKRDVVAYGGVGKPPHREVIFKADDNSTPPDLTVTISFPNPTFTISRVAEASSKDSGENNQITMEDNPSTSRN